MFLHRPMIYELIITTQKIKHRTYNLCIKLNFNSMTGKLIEHFKLKSYIDWFISKKKKKTQTSLENFHLTELFYSFSCEINQLKFDSEPVIYVYPGLFIFLLFLIGSLELTKNYWSPALYYLYILLEIFENKLKIFDNNWLLLFWLAVILILKRNLKRVGINNF